MLATNKINITNYLSLELPFEICNIIEDYTEITTTIVCGESMKFFIKVKIVNVFNQNILEKIYLDDVSNYIVKFSSDGKKLVYLDVNNNIVYYDIYTKSKIIKNMKLIIIKDNNNYCNNYYFDRNGSYYVVSNSENTFIFDIKNNNILEPLIILPFSCSNILTDNTNEIISQNNRIFLRSDDTVYVYDLINGNKIYSFELNHLFLATISTDGNYISYYNNNTHSIDIININISIDEYNPYYKYQIKEDSEIMDIAGIAFYKDLVALYQDNGLIVIINLKTKSKIEEEIDCFDLCNMEFTKDGKYLILKIDDLVIEYITI
jgi:hypothetical protein